MILMFGPAGAGKSLQGQILAIRHNWKWLSAGVLLRQSTDEAVQKVLQSGNLLPVKMVNRVVFHAIEQNAKLYGSDKIILDGYPRSMEQAEGLAEFNKQHDNQIDLIIYLDVTKNEIIKRLSKRGRADDNPAVIAHRLDVYHDETYPILDYYAAKGVAIEKIMGDGTVGQIHDAIEAALAKHHLEGAN